MPHISKQKIPKEIKEQINKKVVGFLTDTNLKTRKGIFDEVFTTTERIMIAKRISLIYMINKNVPPYTITKILKVSPSTVARFRQGVKMGKYNTTVSWVKNYRQMNVILELLLDIASVPFELQKKSLKQFIEDKQK